MGNTPTAGHCPPAAGTAVRSKIFELSVQGKHYKLFRERTFRLLSKAQAAATAERCMPTRNFLISFSNRAAFRFSEGCKPRNVTGTAQVYLEHNMSNIIKPSLSSPFARRVRISISFKAYWKIGKTFQKCLSLLIKVFPPIASISCSIHISNKYARSFA